VKSIKINGVWTHSASMHEKTIAQKTIKWCIKRLGLSRFRNLNITVNISVLKDCWGSCEEGNKDRSYIIHIHNDQTIRNYVRTIIHEMIHVKQYVRNKWTGDGEKEAEKLEEKLADELWKENIL
jgi:predicted metal-dependent hydrolase